MTATATAPRVAGPATLAGLPTRDPEWTRCCVEAFELTPRTVEVGGALAPLVETGGRCSLAGDGALFEPTDFLWADEGELDALADAVVALRRPLYLMRVPSSSPTVAALRERVRATVVRPAGSCPVIEIVDEPERLLSSRRRQDLRRAGRRAAAEGEVTVEVLEPGADEAPGLLERAFAVEAHGWKGRTGSALLYDRRRADFYRRYGAAAAAAGALRVAFLSLDERPAAMQIAIERGGALWLLKIGYDERFASCSPGQLLMAHTLGWAAEHGLERYEFLGAATRWTRTWTREEWPCSSILCYPPTLRGGLVAARDGVRYLGGRAVRR